MTATAKSAQRKGMMIKVHCARRDLVMDDATYRTILGRLFGVESSKDLNVHQLATLLNHFVSLGWQGPTPPAARPRKPAGNKNFVEIPDSDPNAAIKRRILAMWNELGWKMSGIHARCKKQFGVESFLWLKDMDHLQTLSKDLENRIRRKEEAARQA